MDIRLQPKQSLAFVTKALELLYGGAAGGGKSYLLRASAIRWCVEVPGIQVYFFRRTLPDLRDNHLRGPTSFHVMLADHVKEGKVKYRGVENEFEFWNGSILHLCYCDTETDVEKYRGAEIHVLCMDELTHFSEYQYRFLRSRVRVAGLEVPEQYKDRLPRIEAASNPGSIGHAWVKRTFISPREPLKIWQTPADEGGMTRQFIPARLADNPYLTAEDPQYANRLKGLGSENLVRAMLDGDWDIIAGQAFEKLRRETHCIEPFDPPSDWACFGSFDWGSARPFSFGLWAVSSGNALPDGRRYSRGAIIRFNEIYGWNGRPNEGMRREASEVAQMIKARVGERRMAYIAADPSIWKVDGGPSIAETFLKYGVILRKADNSRLIGYIELRGRIAGDEEGPMLYATSNCHDGFWRTMPDIVMDAAHPEDVDTDQEDHCFVRGTEVLTAIGPVEIESASGIRLETTGGLIECDSTPVHTASCVKLTFDDGETVTCTENHKFLTANGWVRAVDLLDEMSYNVLCEYKLSARLARNLRAFAIGFAEGISSARGPDFIAQSGSIIKDRSRPVGTFTTSTGTQDTTKSRIWIWSSSERTFRTTGDRMTRQHGSVPCEKEQRGGMEAQRAARGIPNMLKAIGRNCWIRKWRKFARSVERALWRTGFSRIARSFAILIARPRRCVSVEKVGPKEVLCLHVPVEHNFALADGSIVHNCYDDSRYAAMSRPWAHKPKIVKPKVERWLRRLDEPASNESWRTV